ncbi:MAG: hypothetical protein JWP88_1467 [Flaviaesturariibacter sp.]|nr:hypothetical protein [Flaviaesturariibacter sp.]
MDLFVPNFGLIVWSIIIPFTFLVLALIDILRNHFKGQNEKLIWILAVVFFPVIGAILYFIIGRRNRVGLH